MTLIKVKGKCIVYKKLGYIQTSLRTKVKTTLDNNPVNYFEQMSNKQIRITYVHVQFQRPYIHKYWANIFRQQIDWQNIYHLVNYTLVDNRIKQFIN